MPAPSPKSVQPKAIEIQDLEIGPSTQITCRRAWTDARVLEQGTATEFTFTVKFRQRYQTYRMWITKYPKEHGHTPDPQHADQPNGEDYFGGYLLEIPGDSARTPNCYGHNYEAPYETPIEDLLAERVAAQVHHAAIHSHSDIQAFLPWSNLKAPLAELFAQLPGPGQISNHKKPKILRKTRKDLLVAINDALTHNALLLLLRTFFECEKIGSTTVSTEARATCARHADIQSPYSLADYFDNQIPQKTGCTQLGHQMQRVCVDASQQGQINFAYRPQYCKKEDTVSVVQNAFEQYCLERSTTSNHSYDPIVGKVTLTLPKKAGKCKAVSNGDATTSTFIFQWRAAAGHAHFKSEAKPNLAYLSHFESLNKRGAGFYPRKPGGSSHCRGLLTGSKASEATTIGHHLLAPLTTPYRSATPFAKPPIVKHGSLDSAVQTLLSTLAPLYPTPQTPNTVHNRVRILPAIPKHAANVERELEHWARREVFAMVIAIYTLERPINHEDTAQYSDVNSFFEATEDRSYPLLDHMQHMLSRTNSKQQANTCGDVAAMAVEDCDRALTYGWINENQHTRHCKKSHPIPTDLAKGSRANRSSTVGLVVEHLCNRFRNAIIVTPWSGTENRGDDHEVHPDALMETYKSQLTPTHTQADFEALAAKEGHYSDHECLLIYFEAYRQCMIQSTNQTLCEGEAEQALRTCARQYQWTDEWEDD